MDESKNSQETHEEEMNRLKLEIQQCKDFIQTQHQLLQVSQAFYFLFLYYSYA